MSTTVKPLLQTHPDLATEEVCDLRALYSGGPSWRSRLGTWLPQSIGEDTERLASRHAHATYINYASSVVDLLAAWLLDEPAKAHNPPPVIKTLEKDADGRGTSLSVLLRKAFVDALVEKDVWAWVDMPPSSGADTLAAQRDSGELQPLVSFFKASEILNWQAEDGRLQWVLAYTRDSRQADPLSPRQYIHRWTQIDTEATVIWELVLDEDREARPDSDQLPSPTVIPHGLGFVPVVKFSLTEGLWAMSKLRDPVIRSIRAHNDRHFGLFQAAHPILTITAGSGPRPIRGLDPETGQFEHEDDVETGPGALLTLENGAEAKYIEPSGNAFQHLRQAESDARDDVFRVVHQMALSVGSGDSSRNQSGQSKEQDWEAIQVIMGAYSEDFTEFLEKVLILAAYRGGVAEYEPLIHGMNGWRRKTTAEFIEAAVTTVGAQSMSETFSRETAKLVATHVIGAYVDAETLKRVHDEIDIAPPMGLNLALPGKMLGDDVAKTMGIPTIQELTEEAGGQEEPPPDPEE